VGDRLYAVGRLSGLKRYQSTLNTSSGSSDAVVLKLSRLAPCSTPPTWAPVLWLWHCGRCRRKRIRRRLRLWDFPHDGGRVPDQFGGGYDGFVTKFNSSGGVVYSTYLGGTNSDEAYAIAVDTGGMPTLRAIRTRPRSLMPSRRRPIGECRRRRRIHRQTECHRHCVGIFHLPGGSQYDIGYAIAWMPAGMRMLAATRLQRTFP